MSAPPKITQYGFEWGPMDVVRAMEYRGVHEIIVDTGAHTLAVAVSPKGNSIRVWLDHRPMTVNKDIT